MDGAWLASDPKGFPERYLVNVVLKQHFDTQHLQDVYLMGLYFEIVCSAPSLFLVMLEMRFENLSYSIVPVSPMYTSFFFFFFFFFFNACT